MTLYRILNFSLQDVIRRASEERREVVDTVKRYSTSLQESGYNGVCSASLGQKDDVDASVKSETVMQCCVAQLQLQLCPLYD